MAAFACSQPGAVQAPLRDPDGFAAGVLGRAVTDVERRGKQLLFMLDDAAAITLGMGLWVRLDLRSTALEPLRGVQLGFDPAVPSGGRAVDGASPAGGGAAEDSPAPGRLFLAITEIALAGVRLGHYEPPAGPPPFDALNPRLDGPMLGALSSARAAVKAFLTDDRYVLGIGNGYSDELLWQARVHPRRPCGSLTAGEWAAVATALRAVLTTAFEAGGESGFVGPGGRIGAYDRPIHHHGGEPCPRCGSLLGSLTAGRRETNFCPVCQSL